MLILDTDHLSEMERGSPSGIALEVKLIRSGDVAVSTIISAEEQLRGWLAQIARRDVHDQVDPYRRLQARLAFYAKWTLLPWTPGAADRYIMLRQNKVRIDCAGARRHGAVAEPCGLREGAGVACGELVVTIIESRS